EAAMTIPAAASSAAKPEAGWISVRFVPTVAMTLRPMNHSPATRAMPQVSIAAKGTVASPRMLSVRSTSRTAAKGPTALAMSLEPWLKAKAEAVNTCIQEKRMKVARGKVSLRRVVAKTKTASHTALLTIAITSTQPTVLTLMSMSFRHSYSSLPHLLDAHA